MKRAQITMICEGTINVLATLPCGTSVTSIDCASFTRDSDDEPISAKQEDLLFGLANFISHEDKIINVVFEESGRGKWSVVSKTEEPVER